MTDSSSLPPPTPREALDRLPMSTVVDTLLLVLEVAPEEQRPLVDAVLSVADDGGRAVAARLRQDVAGLPRTPQRRLDLTLAVTAAALGPETVRQLGPALVDAVGTVDDLTDGELLDSRLVANHAVSEMIALAATAVDHYEDLAARTDAGALLDGRHGGRFAMQTAAG